MTELTGWISSIILLLTLGIQIHKQWVERTSRGVSPYLFTGQVVAETGFLTYSVLLKNWVFTVTNFLLLVANFIGLYVTLRFARRGHVQ